MVIFHRAPITISWTYYLQKKILLLMRKFMIAMTLSYCQLCLPNNKNFNRLKITLFPLINLKLKNLPWKKLKIGQLKLKRQKLFKNKTMQPKNVPKNPQNKMEKLKKKLKETNPNTTTWVDFLSVLLRTFWTIAMLTDSQMKVMSFKKKVNGFRSQKSGSKVINHIFKEWESWKKKLMPYQEGMVPNKIFSSSSMTSLKTPNCEKNSRS